MIEEVEWEPGKATCVLAERALVFTDAGTVFLDPLAITIPEEAHSTYEVRHVTIGSTSSGRIRVVVHTERGRRVRIITTWPAEPAERRSYEEHPRR